MVKLNIEVKAEQWLGEKHPLPMNTYICQPETHYSADRTLVYFTYADLRCTNWLELLERPMPVSEKLPVFTSGFQVKLKDGSEYWRISYPFSMWEIKSESSAKKDHRAVYLDRNDSKLMRVFLDYCDVQQWGEKDDRGNRCLPPRAEHRIVAEGYGRGFKPLYLKPTDWVITERGREPYILSDEEFQKRIGK